MYTFNIWLLYASSPFSVRNRRSLRLRTARKNTKLLLPRVCRWMLSQRHGHYHVNVTNFIISMLQVIASDCHGVYLNATNTMFATSRTLSLKCHKHYVRNITNSIIEMSQTVLSMSPTSFSTSKNANKHIIEKWKKHEAAVALRLQVKGLLNVTNTTQVKGLLNVTNTIFEMSRTLLSSRHQLYEMPRTQPWQTLCHELYHFDVTNSSLVTSPTLWSQSRHAIKMPRTQPWQTLCHELYHFNVTNAKLLMPRVCRWKAF